MDSREFLRLLAYYSARNKGTAAFERAQQIFKHLEKAAYPSLSKNPVEREALKMEIYRNISEKILPKRRSYFGNALGIAATFIMLIGVGLALHLLLPRPEPETVLASTGTGERKHITLSDGTLVHLNAGTSLEYPLRFAESAREVTLKGEAFFDVERNPERPFRISTGKITTTVLGTSFNVNAYDSEDNIGISVKSGLVHVGASAPENGELGMGVELGSNEYALYSRNDGSFSKGKGEARAFWAWNEGAFVFPGSDMLEVSRILERWYGAEFTFQDESSKNCVIEGEFKQATLGQILESISFLTGMDYEFDRTKMKVVLKDNTCNEN